MHTCGSGLPLKRLSDTSCQNKMLTSYSISHKPNTRISILAIPCSIGITSDEEQDCPLHKRGLARYQLKYITVVGGNN